MQFIECLLNVIEKSFHFNTKIISSC